MPLKALREADRKFNSWLDQRLGFESEAETARRRQVLPQAQGIGWSRDLRRETLRD
ncbi:MAG: hypothetical protein SNJ52_01965 [Verrucomicrobiia bacterium]